MDEIDLELCSSMKQFIDQIYSSSRNSFKVNILASSSSTSTSIGFLFSSTKNLSFSTDHQTIWSVITSQMISFGQSLMDFCHSTIPSEQFKFSLSSVLHTDLLFVLVFEDFLKLEEKYDILSSSIHAVILLILFEENAFESSKMNLFHQLIQSFPSFHQFQPIISAFQVKFKSFQFNQKEFALLLFVIVTRTSSSFSYSCLSLYFLVCRSLQPTLDAITAAGCSNLLQVSAK